MMHRLDAQRGLAATHDLHPCSGCHALLTIAAAPALNALALGDKIAVIGMRADPEPREDIFAVFGVPGSGCTPVNADTD